MNTKFLDIAFEYISRFETFFWENVGFVLICTIGFWFTIKSRGVQLRAMYNFRKNICDLMHCENHDTVGVHPIKLYFASVGGMIGIGNIVGAGSAVIFGGPGSILWMWLASLCGMLIKYSEIYLGVRHRRINKYGEYCGGPMYYLQEAFSTLNFPQWLIRSLSIFSAFMLCIYCVEVFQFPVIVNTIHTTFHIDKNIIAGVLMISIIYIVFGGVNRLSTVCAVMMPVFIIAYVAACLYIIGVNIHKLPSLLQDIVTSAFSGQAAIGAFTGSTVSNCIRLGTSRAVYSGDIGIGYDSVIQSETKVINPTLQATMSIYALLSDTIVCTMTTLTIAISGIWYTQVNTDPAVVMMDLLGQYFPYSDYFLTIVLFFAGFTTVISFLVAGVKAAVFISPKYGKLVYKVYAVSALWLFVHLPSDKAVSLMNASGGLLITFNIIGIIILRNEINFGRAK